LFRLRILAIQESECWSKQDMRSILEYLLISFCNIPTETTQTLLETFVRRVLSISSSYNRNLEDDLHFLADIEKRSSFIKFDKWKLSVYCLYVCNFLIEHKIDADIHYALERVSCCGHKDTIALLLEHKADVDVKFGLPLRWACVRGHRDTAALLLKHKANVDPYNCNLLLAKEHGHKDVISLLLEHNARF
jgi:hypothetical protein